MYYIISYDIASDKKRRHIFDFLRDKGFYRIQKSVFLGEFCLDELHFLIETLETFISKEEDSIFCIPFTQEEYKKITSIGNNIDYNFYEKDVFFI